MTRRRLYPAKPYGKHVTTLSLDVLKGLGDSPVGVSLDNGEHGLYQWGTLHPLPGAHGNRTWLYVPDYAGTNAPPAFVYAEGSKVRVWRVAVSEL